MKYITHDFDLCVIGGGMSGVCAALSTENGGAWLEDGYRVEQGKEAIQWAKIGYLLGEDRI